jgi:hypothetical protein
VTAADRPDHARGWRFAQELLDEDVFARIDAMSDEDVDGELRAGGVDPDRVPSAEAFLARADALAARAAAAPADHARGWAFAEKLLAEDGEKKPATPDDPRPAEWYLERAAELGRQKETPTKASMAIERTPRRRRTMWAVAAVPAALVSIFAVMNGGAIAAIVRGQPVQPTDTWFPWRPSPSTPQQKAAILRAEALAACGNQDFQGCEALLDQAAQMDPEGEHAKSVVQAREAIGAWHDKMDFGEKPHLKPSPPR